MLLYNLKYNLKMSLLSASHFSTINQAISLIKAQLQQQNCQQMSKFQLISIKLKLIEEQTQQAKQNISKYERQQNNKIETFSNYTKNALKDILELHPKNAGISQLQLEFKQLQNCRDKLVKSNKSLSIELAQKIEAQIDDLQKKVNSKSQQNKDQLKNLQNEFKKEISQTRNKIKQNEELLQQDQAFSQLEAISQRISKEIGKLRDKRVERKQNFLNLLETIVSKCKEDAQQQ